jgi:hypothetical protein
MIEMKFDSNFDMSKWLTKVKDKKLRNILATAGDRGVAALRANTPVGTGKTAASWQYKIKQTKRGVKIVWYNTHIVSKVPIAIILQYGHGTRQGGYVQGRDYINPAMKPIFDEIDRMVERAIANG